MEAMTLKVVEGSGDSTIQSFLEFLYGNVEGYIYTPSKIRTSGDTRDPWTQKFFKWPEQKHEAVEYIVDTAAHEEIYCSPALFSAESSLKEHLLGSWVVWVEHDGKLPESLEEAPEPTLKIQSSESGHEHWYWKLEEFANDIKWIEEVNRSLSYKLGADTSGWDANQVLRPPNTLNHKRNRQVKVLSANDWRFQSARFDIVERPPVASQIFTDVDRLDITSIIAFHPWTPEALDLFRNRDVQEGERSTKLMNLGYLCAEMGLNDQEIFTVLFAADEWWGKFHDRRDRDQRLNDIIVRARVKHPTNATVIEVYELPVMGVHEMLTSTIELNWAIENCLEDNGCMVLAARPGIGKTRLSLQAAISLALGVPFLKYDIPKAKRVGFFSLEMHQAGIQYFLKHMTRNMPEELIMQLQDRIKIVPLGEPFDVLDPVKQAVLQAYIEKHEIEVLFLDSLGRITVKSLNSDEDTKTLFDFDSKLRKKFGIATWHVHHNRKATAQNKQPKTQDDVYGSVYITASATDVYALWSKDTVNTDIKFINLKHRYSEQEREYGVATGQNLMFAVQTTAQRRLAASTEVSDSGLINSRDIDDDEPEPPTQGYNIGLSF